MNFRKMKSRKGKLFFIIGLTAMLYLSLGARSRSLKAQGVTNVNVMGIPTIINNPNVDQIEQNFYNGRYQLLFTYNSNSPTNRAPVDFRFRFTLNKGGDEVVEFTSDPKSLRPGTHVFVEVFRQLSFPQTFEQVLSQADSKIRNQVIQEGTLPEGSYNLYVRVIPEEDAAGTIVSTPSITPFVVRYPQAPSLVTPSDGSSVPLSTPVFTWTPVIGITDQPIQYRFLLVEILDNQTPLQAINGNRAHAEISLIDQSTFTYNPAFLPLEEGKRYAWQITAQSAGVERAIKNDGESPIFTFTYTGAAAGTGPGSLTEVVLQPDFGKLVNLDGLDIERNGNITVLNGSADLELIFGDQTYTVPVTVSDLNLTGAGQEIPSIISGSIETGRVQGILPALEGATDLVNIDRLRWMVGTGFQVRGNMVLPDGTAIASDNWVQLTPIGLNGTLLAENTNGFFSAGGDPLEIVLTRIETLFPAGQMFASGNLDLFSGGIGCTISQFNLLEEQSVPILSCPDTPEISLFENLDHLKLAFNNLGGNLDFNFDTEQLDFSLNGAGHLIPGLQNQGECAVNFSLELTSANGLNISQITPGCSIYAPPIDLGLVKLKPIDLNLTSLNYSGGGKWDYDLSIDGMMTIPAMDDWQLPVTTVDVTSNGLQFPDVSWDAGELGLDGPLEINGFEIEPVEFTMGTFTFPWFDWSSQDIANGEAGNWNFTMDFDFRLPGAGQGSILPSCVADRQISVEDSEFADGSLSATIPATILQDCSVEIAEGYTFIINELSGELTTEASASNLNLDAELSLDAAFEAGFPFACSGEDPVEAANTQLTLNSNGLLEGSIEDIVNACPARIGPFRAEVTSSDLIFAVEQGEQQITIEADANLILNQQQRISGTFSYDMMNGEFEELDFTLEEPFLWNLPSDDRPVLTFLIDELSISEEGILIDGRHQFLIGDRQRLEEMVRRSTGESVTIPEDVTSIGVTFDQTLFSLGDFNIKSGSIIFDESFALQAGIDPQNQELSYSVLDSLDEQGLPANSLYTELGSSVMIDSAGMHTGGTARAGIQFGELAYDDLSVDFSNDFAMSLRPFKVAQGQADIEYQNRRVAYIDNTGLSLDPTFLTQAIPDTLGLPTKETAYIVLRDQNGDLKLQVQQQSDGTYVMSTQTPLDLVIPALQGNKVLPPTTAVSFSNVTYDPGSQEVTAGTIEGDFQPDIDLTDMGVPFTLKSIRYDDGFVAGTNMRGLFLDGDIKLYEHQFGDNGQATLYLENGDRLTGDIDLQNLDADLPLVPQSNLAVLNVDSLEGTVDVPLDGDPLPSVLFDMGGQFRLSDQSGNPMATLNYRASYDDENFVISGISQPSQAQDGGSFFAGALGFRIDKIRTLTIDYRSATNDFDFRSELDFSLLMDLQDGDTVEVPLKMAEITESGFTIQDQTLNGSSAPPLDVPAFAMGPAELTMLEFRILNDIWFNWFNGEGVPPAFEMDLEIKLASLSEEGPQASQASITLNNVGFNQGVITGQIYPYSFDDGGAPLALGGDTGFILEQVEGGLTNDGTDEDPVQGYDIELTGRMDYPAIFTGMPSGCTEPAITVNLSSGGGLVGSISNITPCGELVYGPATLAFDPSTSIEFLFSNDTQSILLDGSVTAEIERQNTQNITATGDIAVDVISGQFSSGSIQIDDLFIYEYPSADPLFTFRVQRARLDQTGVVFTGDAGLAYPNSPDTARVQFTNFTIHPQEDNITSGSLTIRDSLAIEAGISPIEWYLADPSSDFTRNNAARLLTTAGITLDQNGLSLSGSSTASIQAGGQSLPDLSLDYNGFQVGFNPTRVTAGTAEFTMSGENTPFGHLDEDGFDLDIPGLITSVVPDTVDIPNRQTAFLVLGDEEGNRYEYLEDQGQRTLRTLPGETVELVIPGFTDSSNDTLKTQVTFDLTVDQFFNVNGGSVSLQNDVDLEPYVQLPVTITELGYEGSTKELAAGATVKLPESLNDVNMTSTLVIDDTGFKQGTISAGEYRTSYLPSQENVTPIAADTLGQETLEFYVRGLEIGFGQNRSASFSGQLKSDLLKDTEGNKPPLHFAAGYSQNGWDFNVDASHLPQDGIDLGFAKVEPIQDPAGGYQGMFDVIMNQEEFAVSFAGIVTLPDVAGDGFEVTVQQLKIGSVSPYVSIDSEAELPNQQFALFGDVMTFNTTNTTVSISNEVLAIEMDGTFDFYTEQDIGFEDMVFKSDGTVDIQGGLNANLLPEELEILSDSTLVLEELNLNLEDNTLGLAANGSAKLPEPLAATSEVTINADTKGNVDVSGPNFVFDEGFNIDGDPTEYQIGSLATLELTGLGMDINLKNPGNTALYAAGVIFMENNVDKRIMFGDAGDLQHNPGIKYSPNQGVEWNVQSNFDPENSPLSFDYEFFSISVASIQIQNDVTVDNETVPFQAEIGGQTGLNIGGVEGEVGFSGFKFSTKGVDDIGKIDGGGTFTLMGIVSLELGEFEYNSAPEGQTVTLKFAEGQSGQGDPSVDSTEVQVRKYLHFRPGLGGQALRISLTEGISGGIEEVLYYEGDDGELYLRIKNASVSLHDQAQLSVGMEYITAGSGGSGYSLMVAGSGTLSSVGGIAAAGKISTLNSELSFGVFVAVQAPINILGLVEASALGGGFFYRPDMDDLNMVIDGVENLDDQFDLNGPQPDVQNLDLAILLYANISIVGGGGQAAIAGSGLIQITDQFLKIDIDGVVLNQDGRLEGEMYLTVLYTPEIAGAEGSIQMLVDYGAAINGSARIDFFATKDRTQPGSAVLWGVTGNMDFTAMQMLELSGQFIVSADGMLVDVTLSRGLDTAIISANSSFTLTAWYLPGYAADVGMFAQFKAELDIVKGVASVGIGVKGGYFHRTDYHLLYFAGSAHVDVVVFEGRVHGWVKVRTKSPPIQFGAGRNHQMEQMISDARERANESSAKAEETREDINDANEELENSIAENTQFKRTAQQLEKAGFRMFTDEAFNPPYDRASILDNVKQPAEGLYSSYFGLTDFSDSPLSTIYNDYMLDYQQPRIRSLSQSRSDAEAGVQSAQDAAGPVETRLQQGRDELQQLSDRMQSQLDEEGIQITNPVGNVQEAVTGSEGELISAPGFTVDTEAVDSNSVRLNRLDNERQQAAQRYREAVRAAAANVELVDLVLEGNASVDWGPETGVQMEEQSQQSVAQVANQYYNAVQLVRNHNSRLIAQYWKLHDWADEGFSYLEQNQNSIESYVDWNSSWEIYSNTLGSAAPGLQAAADLAVAMDEALATFEGTSPTQNIRQVVLQNDATAHDKFTELAIDFWYRMPRLGLQAVRDESKEKADSLDIVFENNLSAVNASYSDLTRTVDELYGIKTGMLTTVYGMIEEYNAWRTTLPDEQGQPPEAPFTDKLQTIEQALAPPTIDNIEGGVVSAQNTYTPVADYYSKAFLDFGASHPIGISEISFNLIEGTIPTSYLVQDYYSKGFFVQGGSGIRYDYPKRAVNQYSQPLTGIVRARSSGGVTTERLLNFEIPVAPGSGLSTVTVTKMGDDTSPPTQPSIDDNYLKYNGSFWTPDSSELSFTIKSMDLESGIDLFQYKIGTTPGGNQMREWTDAQGARGLAAGLHEKMETTIRGVTLEQGMEYYLSFRTVNGDNDTSSVKQLSYPITFEPTPPADPAVTITPDPSSLDRQKATTQPVLRQAVSDYPDWNSNRVNEDGGSVTGQEYNLSWSSNDPETSIKGFSVSLKPTETLPAEQAFGPNDIDFIPAGQSTELTHTFSFNNEEYLYIRARNHAGIKSNLDRIGPIRGIDITPPTTPDARVETGFDKFIIYITQLSDDSQTGIKGYQYAILDSTGTNILRSWPDSTTVDFSFHSNIGSQNLPPYEAIPASAFLSTGTYQVMVRAVNNQNMISRPVLVQNVFLDRTPPEKVVAASTYDGARRFSIDFSKIGGDPESGLKGMRYEIEAEGRFGQASLVKGTIENPSTQLPFRFSVDSQYFQNHPQITDTTDPNDYLSYMSIYLYITSRNHAGLETTNKIRVTIPDAYEQDYLSELQSIWNAQQQEQQQSPSINLNQRN